MMNKEEHPRCPHCDNYLSSIGPEDGPPFCPVCGRSGQDVLSANKAQFISSDHLRKNIGPENQPALTVQELHDQLAECIKQGHGQAPVCFDAEARSFDAHYIDLHAVSCDDVMGDGSMVICMLTTSYH
jgi:hypothetical protein